MEYTHRHLTESLLEYKNVPMKLQVQVRLKKAI